MKESAKRSVLKQLIKEGYSEDEAMKIANSVFGDEEDRAQGESGEMAYSREIIKNAQLEARSALLPSVQAQLLGKKDDFWREMMNTIMQLKTMEMMLSRDEKNSEISRLLEKLNKEIEDMRMKALEAEIQHRDRVLEELKEQFKSLRKELTSLMEEISQRNFAPREDITTRIANDFQILQEVKEWLIQLGIVREKKDSMDEKELVEQLRREGYRIEGPPTLEAVHRKVEEEVKKREQEIRKEVEELRVKKERTRMAMDFILALMDGVMGVVSASGGGNQEEQNGQAGA